MKKKVEAEEFDAYREEVLEKNIQDLLRDTKLFLEKLDEMEVV